MPAPCKQCQQRVAAPGCNPNGLCRSCLADQTAAGHYTPIYHPPRKRMLGNRKRKKLRKKVRVFISLCPTDALPGTPEKVAIMEERVRNRWHVHHPEDAKTNDPLLTDTW